MKILHVAVFTPNSTNIWQANAFETVGCEVIRFDYRAVAAKHGFSIRDQLLIEICKQQRPDITLFSKCNQMDIEVVKQCNLYSDKTVLWMMDNWHNMDEELIEKIIHCNIVFFAGWRELEIGKTLNPNSFKLHGGYDPEIHCPINTEKIYDISFIGTVYTYRIPYYNALKFPVFTNAYGKEHSKIVSQTKINLSFVEGSSPSNRLYKILAAGGFCLTNPWEHLIREFEPGIHFDIFKNINELKEKIKFYLENEQLRQQIAQYGYHHVKKYDAINYAKTVIKKSKQL